MTILLVHNRYQQPGGEDQVFEAEHAMLREAGHEVILHEVHNDAVTTMGVLSLALRTLWNPKTSRDIRRLIRTRRPDVVHCHNTFPLISPSLYWACRKEGVPVVQTLHNFRLTCLNAYLFRDGKVCERCFGRFPWAGLRFRCYRDSLSASCVAALCWLLHFRVLRTYHRAVDRFVVLTEFGRAKMLSLGLPTEKLVVKPNVIRKADADGENPGHHRGNATATRNAPRPQVLYVGRLSSEKGVDILIRAWNLAQERLPVGSQLLVVGDGPERPALERLVSTTRQPKGATLGEAGRTDPALPSEPPGSVRFLGRQPKERVLELMRACNLFVLPSLCYETFGMALNEAASCECPGVVPDHGALAELVQEGQTGFHFHAGDVDDLAGKLVKALSGPCRLATMGCAAAEAIRNSDAEPGRNVKRLITIYSDLRPRCSDELSR